MLREVGEVCESVIGPLPAAQQSWTTDGLISPGGAGTQGSVASGVEPPMRQMESFRACSYKGLTRAEQELGNSSACSFFC